MFLNVLNSRFYLMMRDCVIQGISLMIFLTFIAKVVGTKQDVINEFYKVAWGCGFFFFRLVEVKSGQLQEASEEIVALW